MARSMKCVVCLITLSLVVSFPSDDVIIYTKDRFQSAITKDNHFVLFCKPISNPCKRVTPLWAELHQLYGSNGSAVLLAQVDCTAEKELCADQKVKHMPVFRFFYKDPTDFTDFKGRRTFESLHRFIEDEIHNAENVTVPTLPDAVVELGAKRFRNFIAQELHFVQFYSPWCGHCKMLAPTWHQLAMEVAGSVHLFISQVDCSKASNLCVDYGIKGYPSLVLFSNGTEIDRYTGNRDLESLKGYVESKVDEYVEDEIPETETENGVLVLTEESFSFIVNENLVLVNFYTPWCERCKEVLEVWQQLAEANRDRELVLAKVDCEDQTYICQSRSITVFPTLILYQEGLHLYDYNENLTLEDLQKFIDKFTIMLHSEL
ncbi:thioredoxin domain-containing protein 5-like [Babylonia areolata]|uniref:thioredoxin domain-containing protein 5-like n=1 Tax=Babylonia areolata TaxID=304850 RepID=UPI003FCF6E2A